MELAGPLALLQASDSQPLVAPAGVRSLAAPETGKLATALDSRTPHQKPAHFDDILDQTLAGPLFATWSPTAAINPTAKPGATNASVAALDANGRRDGRKRSRR